MKDSELFELARAAFRIAFNGANQYLHVHKLQADDKALTECVKSWVNIKFPEAMADAKEAIECNMTQVAIQTFAASMVQAGIEAAKECSFPIPSVSANLVQTLTA